MYSPILLRRIILMPLIFWVSTFVGQTLGKGIYRGEKLPFTICYLTYSDSIIEVEYFFQKGGQIFGHTPNKKLVIGIESFVTKPIFKSVDDSITVFVKKDSYLVKRRGFDRIKVYKSTDTQLDITTLRNRNKLFLFSHNLHNELRQGKDFDDKLFWDKLHSYGLEKYITLDSVSFNTELDEIKADIKKNWR